MSDCVRFRVSGRVQGVGFRAHTRTVARAHHLSGGATNCSDDSVDILLFGRAESIDAAKPDIIAGPVHARVERVESLDPPVQPPVTGFVIR